MQVDSDSQCAFNRAGRLCGGCKDNYSLAIGSSHCMLCPNNNNLALLIFFAAAGFLLVFFISAFNLTVTQGMINGLIFYANIVWVYQCIFFPEEQKLNTSLMFLKTFVAWVNLDFGIETCFVKGLTAFWKAWLQFIFPFYIWAIAGVIIVVARYSTRLTNFLTNKAVPVLNTLFLLSYMKLLRIVVTALEFLPSQSTQMAQQLQCGQGTETSTILDFLMSCYSWLDWVHCFFSGFPTHYCCSQFSGFEGFPFSCF